MKYLIKNATLVNEGIEHVASVLIEDDCIAQIIDEQLSLERELANEETARQVESEDTMVIDATGMLLMPGVIDDHVHMRDPGLTHKADMDSETRAAAAGGVTSVMDMPNVVPQTTTLELWQQKMDYASQHCHVNYAMYLGATNDNLEEIKRMDTTRIPALKLFMGSSTGGMLVDKEEQLRTIFAECPTLIMTHCEDTDRINERMAEAKQKDADPAIDLHPWIRDDEACYRSSALAVRLGKETGARLHIAHITTAKELELLEQPVPQPDTLPLQGAGHLPQGKTQSLGRNLSAEVCPQHLFFTDEDYKRLGSLIKCNPAIKSKKDRDALRQAILDGKISVIGTDHAPHLLDEKQGGAAKAVSGMPLVQFSLPLMLTLSDKGILPRALLVELMCHNPARLFGIEKRGFIRPGFKADLVLLKKEAWTIQESDILSKCGWSPLTGESMTWKVARTWCNGHLVFDGKEVDNTYLGEALRFNSLNSL